jgi:hypothetical protein
MNLNNEYRGSHAPNTRLCMLSYKLVYPKTKDRSRQRQSPNAEFPNTTIYHLIRLSLSSKSIQALLWKTAYPFLSSSIRSSTFPRRAGILPPKKRGNCRRMPLRARSCASKRSYSIFNVSATTPFPLQRRHLPGVSESGIVGGAYATW